MKRSFVEHTVTYNQPILNLSLDKLKECIISLGEKKFRAEQIADWIYQRHAHSYDEMTNISLPLREKLKTVAPLHRARIVEQQISSDGTRKYLIGYADGVSVEAVGLPTSERLTVCMSSQAGCNMGCIFCATGQAGFTRNLTPGEMTEQVRLIAQDFERRVSNVVVMGQGEPFLNYDNVLAALRILNNARYFNIGARHITVSTCGIIKGIERLSQEPEQFTLAVSLHSARQKTRDALMPGVKNQTLPALERALRAYEQATNRRPSLEFTLIKGAQSSLEEIKALASFAQRTSAHINLIPVNPSADKSIVPPAREEILAIERTLDELHVNATLRTERGADIAAACGQLAQLANEHPCTSSLDTSNCCTR